MKRRGVFGYLGLCGLLLAACGSPKTGTVAGSTSTVLPQCSDPQLEASVSAIDHRNGELRLTVMFRNTSELTCVIGGNPAVSLVGPQGQDLGDADQSPAPDPPTRVTLAPSQAAVAYLFARETPDSRLTATCVSGSQLSVLQPNGNDAMAVDLSGVAGGAAGIDICGSATVGPLQAPSSGGGSFLAPCPEATISVHPGNVLNKKGHKAIVILLQNDSGEQCTVTGYAGVSALDAQGETALSAVQSLRGYLGGILKSGLQRVNTNTYAVPSPPIVTLNPGMRASLLIEGTSPLNSTCTSYSTFSVLPPTGSSGPQVDTVEISGGLCGPLQVHPIVSGTSGSR